MSDAPPGPNKIQNYMDSLLSETIQEQACIEPYWELISSPPEIPPSQVSSCSTKCNKGTFSHEDSPYHLVENRLLGQIVSSSFLIEKGRCVQVVHHEVFKNCFLINYSTFLINKHFLNPSRKHTIYEFAGRVWGTNLEAVCVFHISVSTHSLFIEGSNSFCVYFGKIDDPSDKIFYNFFIKNYINLIPFYNNNIYFKKINLSGGGQQSLDVKDRWLDDEQITDSINNFINQSSTPQSHHKILVWSIASALLFFRGYVQEDFCSQFINSEDGENTLILLPYNDAFHQSNLVVSVEEQFTIGQHWVLVAFWIKFRTVKAFLFDNLRHNEEQHQKINSVIFEKLGINISQNLSEFFQSNLYDCGIFNILFAKRMINLFLSNQLNSIDSAHVKHFVNQDKSCFYSCVDIERKSFETKKCSSVHKNIRKRRADVLNRPWKRLKTLFNDNPLTQFKYLLVTLSNVKTQFILKILHFDIETLVLGKKLSDEDEIIVIAA
ncbi:hypothetical protein P9112_007490 [Eukaryota sp. TZLM1-RC]